jgi:hypothetical protein
VQLAVTVVPEVMDPARGANVGPLAFGGHVAEDENWFPDPALTTAVQWVGSIAFWRTLLLLPEFRLMPAIVQ